MSKIKNTNKTSKIILLIIVGIFLTINLYSPTPIHAQQKTNSLISISPTIFNIILSPGKKYSYQIKITNNTDAPLPLQKTLEPIITPDDENPQEQLSQNIVPWIKTQTDQMIIEPKQTRNFDFTVQVPSQVPLGGYYGMMYFQPLFPKKQGNTEIVTKFGVLLLGSVGVQEIPLNKVKITNQKFSSYFYESGNPDLMFTVKNTALNHFSAKPFIKLKPVYGPEKFFEFEEKFVFPGKSRIWKSILPVSQWGFYEGTLYISVGGGFQKTTNISFAIFPLKKTLLLAFTVIFIIVLIRKKDRFKKALQILFKG